MLIRDTLPFVDSLPTAADDSRQARRSTGKGKNSGHNGIWRVTHGVLMRLGLANVNHKASEPKRVA
jgi:hypothetical protein